MVDVSGIPNMGFGGGGYFGGIPNQQPAMSAAQINAGMWGNYSPGAAQATANNIYGAGGFGAQPAYYAALGAAYGRQVAPSSPAAVAAYHGGGGGYSGGGIGSDAARAPNQPEIQSNIPWGGYNAPRQYGWMPNEGAPAPAAPQVYNMGEFNPHTYGWDANEGAPAPTQMEQPDWLDIWRRALPLYMPPTSPSSVSVPSQQSSLGAVESYFQRNPDVWNAAKASGRGLIGFGAEHILAHGEDEGRELFNPVKYLEQNQDVAKAGMDAWQHYDKFGRGEGREATWGNVFNPDTYLRLNQDVKNAGVDPRTHWLQYGQSEGRQGGGIDPFAGATRDAIARAVQAQQPAQSAGSAPTHPGNAYNQPSSGYLGIQSRVMQDPFGGYRSPADMNAGGGFPADYRQGFYGQQGFTPFENQSGG